MTTTSDAITWGGLKAWADANGVTDAAEVSWRPAGAPDDKPVRDIDHEDPEPAEDPDPDDPEDEGQPASPERLVLMERFGD